MIESTPLFRRSLRVVALALSSAVIAASATPASARSHHGSVRHAHVRHFAHTAKRHFHHARRTVRASRLERAAQTRGAGSDLGGDRASLMSSAGSRAMLTSGGFGSNLVAEARRYLGGNPTSRGRLWCARFMNMVLERTGHHGTGSDMASSFASYGQRVSGPQVGAIAVMARRGGGHVGVVSGIDAQGNPILISGNYGNRVREVPISRGRIYAYVMPN